MLVSSLRARHSGRRLKFVLGSTAIGTGAALFEVCAVIATSMFTGLLWHVFAYGAPGDANSYFGVGALTGVLYTMPYVLRSEYRVDNFLGSHRAPARILNVWLYAFFCLGALAFLTKTIGLASRGWLALFFVAGAATVTASNSMLRYAVRRLVTKGMVQSRRLMVVGTRDDIACFVDRHSAAATGIEVLATATLPDGTSHCGNGEVAGLVEAAIERARTQSISDVMILVPNEDAARLARSIASKFMDLPVAVHLGKQVLAERFPDLQVAHIGKTRTLTLRRKPLDTYQLATKRLFDCVVASLAIIMLSPLLALIAVAIKLDSRGPVFFRQRRRGFNQQEFRIWKFRTMSTLDDGDRIVQATTNDPRVTRVGAILRRCNLDELPQLINVLTGDMSLVGPRPHAVAHDRYYERVIKRYSRRLNVKPGITGWAQVNGFRGLTETEHAMRSRITHDLYYIDNWSIALDIYIIALTVISPKAFRNAG